MICVSNGLGNKYSQLYKHLKIEPSIDDEGKHNHHPAIFVDVYSQETRRFVDETGRHQQFRAADTSSSDCRLLEEPTYERALGVCCTWARENMENYGNLLSVRPALRKNGEIVIILVQKVVGVEFEGDPPIPLRIDVFRTVTVEGFRSVDYGLRQLGYLIYGMAIFPSEQAFGSIGCQVRVGARRFVVTAYHNLVHQEYSMRNGVRAMSYNKHFPIGCDVYHSTELALLVDQLQQQGRWEHFLALKPHQRTAFLNRRVEQISELHKDQKQDLVVMGRFVGAYPQYDIALIELSPAYASLTEDSRNVHHVSVNIDNNSDFQELSNPLVELHYNPETFRLEVERGTALLYKAGEVPRRASFGFVPVYAHGVGATSGTARSFELGTLQEINYSLDFHDAPNRMLAYKMRAIGWPMQGGDSGMCLWSKNVNSAQELPENPTYFMGILVTHDEDAAEGPYSSVIPAEFVDVAVSSILNEMWKVGRIQKPSSSVAHGKERDNDILV